MGWIDGFNDNSWLRIARHNSATGKFQVNGTNIDPYEFTKAEFDALTSSDYAGIEVRVTNIHMTAAGVGGVRFIGGASWILASSQIYYATYAAALTAFPAASWPGLVIRCGDVGNGLVDLISNGTRYLPKGGIACLFRESWGTLAAPTNNISAGTGGTSTIFPIGTPTFPAALFAITDSFRLNGRVKRHNANATMVVRVNIGTAGDGGDSDLWVYTMAATDVLITPFDVSASIGSATVYSTNQSNQMAGSGSTSQSIDRTTNFNVASAMQLSVSISSKNASDTLDLIDLSFDWVAV